MKNLLRNHHDCLFLPELSLSTSNIHLKFEQKQSQFECFLATIPKVRETPSRKPPGAALVFDSCIRICQRKTHFPSTS